MKNMWICRCEKGHKFVYMSEDNLEDETILSAECQVCINERIKKK